MPAICGVQAASRFYFGRDLPDLSLAEWATLAGLIRNPGGYNPFRHPQAAVERRNYVLDAMERMGAVSASDVERVKREPLQLASGSGGWGKGSYVADLVRSQLAETYSERVLAKEGLRTAYPQIDDHRHGQDRQPRRGKPEIGGHLQGEI